MQKYGAYQADSPDGDITWFRTGEDIAAIDASEQAGQAGHAFPGMDNAAVRKNMASQLTSAS